jgi:hypothetical protein
MSSKPFQGTVHKAQKDVMQKQGKPWQESDEQEL